MGDGLVIQKGRHNELLQDEDGPYARLVAAQKLRETQNSTEITEDDTDGGSSKSSKTDHDIEKEVQEEIPLGRRDTQRSLASQILEQRQQEKGSQDTKSYSMYYLFKRMGSINKTERNRYILGAICATSELAQCSH
jgi:ATP-binding cassette, subfamily B (MDR/TAP), member 1